MSETTPTLQAPRPLFGTERRDNWWVGPLLTAVGLGILGFQHLAVQRRELQRTLGTTVRTVVEAAEQSVSR